MMTEQNPTLANIEIPPTNGDAKQSVIWLHGLGADGSDFVSIIPELKLNADAGVRFIFPHAPVRPVTINQGFPMRAWFDIHGLTHEAKIDAQGIKEAAVLIEELIEREISRGIASQNITLAGFSQGAALALVAGLCYTKPLAGIIALSGFLPMADAVFKQASHANKKIPIFLAHGTEDTVVPYAYGKATYVALQQAGYHVDWRSYPMGHAVNAVEIGDISLWMKG